MSYYISLPNGTYVEVPDDVSREQAMREISLDPRFRPIIEQSFEKEKNLLRDIPGYLVRGVGQVPTAVGSLINVVPGMEQNIVGRGLRAAGEAISGAGTSILSPGTQRQQALFDLAMQEAENQGLTDQAKTALAEAIRNPRIAAGIAIESLPSLVGSFGAGLATRAAAGVASRFAGRQLTEQAARRAAVAGAVGSEALLEGGGSADEVYRSIMALPEEQLQRSPEYQDLLKQGLKPDEAKERLAVSAARQAAAQTAAISGTVGAVIPGAESAMFRPLTQRGVAGRALGVAAPELVQQAGQEGGAALSENIARQRAEVDRGLLAGVGSRATMGAIVGGLTGAGVGAIRGGPGPEIDRTEDAELRNILNEYVNVRGEAPAVPPTVSERDAQAAAFVAANLPISEEMFLAMPPAGRARVMAIARNRADRVAAQQQEQSFRQEAETRAAEQAEQARVQEIAGRQARAQEETAALTAAGREATLTTIDGVPRQLGVTPQEELSRAVQESRATMPAIREATTARYVEARAIEAPNQPISLPAFQQYLKDMLGRPVTLQEARDSLEGYFQSANDMRVKPRFTLEKKDDRYIARDSDYRGEGVQVKRAPPSKRLGESIATGETTSPFGEPGVAPESPAFALPPDVKESLRDLRRGVKLQQQSLVNFLKSVGGLNNTGYMAGEVFDILGSYTARPGLINNQPRTIIKDQYGRPAGYRGGLSLDAAREKLVEEGYLPEDADINDMLNAIREELSGGAVNYGITQDYEGQERQRAAQQLERALDEAGVSANDSDEDIAAALGLEFPTKPRTLEDIEAESQARFAGVPPKELGPAEEYSRRKPRGVIGPTTPMKVSIPESFQTEQQKKTEKQTPEQIQQQAEQAEQAAKQREANEARRIEILQRLNDEYLAKLEAKGPQGKRAADAVRKSLEDRTLTAEQLYNAFKGAEIITDTLPAKADHEIEFVKHLTDASGQEVQGKRMEVKDSSAAGIIKLSLSESQLPLLGETSSHEGFHVLQDYYGKYDPDFRRLMKQSFRDGMTINDVDSTIKRKLQTIRIPNGEQSYWDALVQSLPKGEIKGPKGTSEGGAREAEAYVFGSLAEAARRGVPMTGMKPAFTRFVNFLTKFFRRMKSAIRGDGFNSPDDVLGKVVEGDAARFAGEAAPEFRGSESSARLTKSEKDDDYIQERLFDLMAKPGPNIVVMRDAQKKLEDASNEEMKFYDKIFAPPYNGKFSRADRVTQKRLGEAVFNARKEYDAISNYVFHNGPGNWVEELFGSGFKGEALTPKSMEDIISGAEAKISEATGIKFPNKPYFSRGLEPESQLSLSNTKTKKLTSSEEYSARLPPGSATYQAAAQKINGDRLKQNSVLKRGIDALVGARAEYTYLYSGKKEAVKGKTSLALNMVNRAHPAHLLDNLLRLKGKPQMADVGRAWESAMNNDGRIARMVEAGGYKYDKKQGIPVIDKAVKSLGDIFMGRVKAEESDAAQRYFVALRERDLRKQGRQGFTNISDNEINEIIKYSETNRPEWKNVAKDYDAWNKGLVQFLVDTDVIKQDVADQLGNAFYTPFYRLLEEDGKTNPDEVIGPSTAAAMKNPSDALKKLGGGEQQLGNLFENIIRNADAIVRSGLKNVAMQKTVAAMEAAGLAKKVPTKVTGAKNIATIRKGGDNVYYQIDDPLMMIAISTMPETMQNGIYQAMTSVGGFIRDMITSAPSFMLANLWRGKKISFVQEAVPFTKSTILSLRDALKQTASFGAIQDVTGFGALTYGMGSRDVASEFQRQLRMKDGSGSIMDRVKGIIVGLQRFSEATEMAERMKLTEYHLSKGKSLNEAAWEGYAMAPFSRRGMGQGLVGNAVSLLAPLVPFLNARIQGNYRLIEKASPAMFGKQLLLRGMVLMAFSLGMAMLASDDERWDRETPDRKFLYDIFYVGDRQILLPRAFEVGTLFGALPVFAFDAARKQSGEDLGRALGLTLMSTFGLTPIPAAVAPVLEVATNYDFFLGRELESAGIRSRPVSERVQPGTTEAAKLTSAAINETLGNLPRGMKVELSPIQAQALLEGYLGTTGMMILGAIDGLLGWTGATPKKPAGPLGDPNSPLGIAATLSGVKRFIKSDEERVDRFVGDFYDLKREVMQWTAALSDAANAGNMDRVREIQAEKGSTIAMQNAVNQVGRAVAQISRQMKAIYDNQQITDPYEKAAALAPLRAERNRLTERIMQLAREQGVR